MNKLENARETINRIDAEMAALYEERMRAARDVAEYKEENGLPIFDPAREEAVILRNAARIENPEFRGMYQKFLQFLMDQSKDYQKSLLSRDIVAYAGVEGAFSHMISQKLFADNPKLAFNSFEDVINAVVDKRAEFGVIPFENTSSGLVGEVLDLLRTSPVYIREVADLKVDQCLLGLPEASLKDIEWVYSKDQALMQSREFLESLGVQTVPYPNTALAAQFVAREGDVTKAAIGARENAALYNLKVLASHIESTAENTTRFLVIGDEPSRGDGDHMSFLLSINDEPGSLARVINVVSAHGLNMDCLQSRPDKDRPFEYFFYIQCTGDLSGENIRSLEEDLAGMTSSFKVLGRYCIKKEE